MVQGTKKKEVNQYYTYIIVYVDDIIIMENTLAISYLC